MIGDLYAHFFVAFIIGSLLIILGTIVYSLLAGRPSARDKLPKSSEELERRFKAELARVWKAPILEDVEMSQYDDPSQELRDELRREYLRNAARLRTLKWVVLAIMILGVIAFLFR